jgi:hypothetical protein
MPGRDHVAAKMAVRPAADAARAWLVALRRSAPEGVFDLRAGLLEVAFGLVTATFGTQAPTAGDTAGGLLAPPFTASALCAILLAILIRLPSAGLLQGRTHRRRYPWRGHRRRAAR